MSRVLQPILALAAFAVVCCFGKVHAQNFVPNPSFELATGCVTGNGWASVDSWRVPTSHSGSPDRFHVCAPGTFGVTANVFGDQAARTGSAYVGFVTHFGTNGLFREYLRAPLTSALSIGTSYTATGYLSLSDGSGWATDGFGFYFSTTAVTGSGNSAPLALTPQVACPTNTFINDKIGWMAVSGNFVATAAFQHITFGNFKTDAATNVQVQPSGWTWNYTYLDDVSVTPAVILSAELRDFTGMAIDAGAALQWQSASEVGTASYAIERSVGDVLHFETIGMVSATGGPDAAAEYEFLDAGFQPNQLNYYRLREIDQNGAGGFSSTIELHTDQLVNEVKVVTYPNPVSEGDHLMLALQSNKEQSLRIEIMDLTGRIVFMQQVDVAVGENLLDVPTDGLSPACYVARVTGQGILEASKFMVTK